MINTKKPTHNDTRNWNIFVSSWNQEIFVNKYFQKDKKVKISKVGNTKNKTIWKNNWNHKPPFKSLRVKNKIHKVSRWSKKNHNIFIGVKVTSFFVSIKLYHLYKK